MQKHKKNAKNVRKMQEKNHIKFDNERILHLRKIGNLCLILKDDDSRIRLIHPVVTGAYINTNNLECAVSYQTVQVKADEHLRNFAV